jgi:hypothetical protein
MGGASSSSNTSPGIMGGSSFYLGEGYLSVLAELSCNLGGAIL